MNDEELVKMICDEFETQEFAMRSPDFYELGAGVVYYMSLIRIVKAKPFQPECVQNQVLLRLDEKLMEVMQQITRRPLAMVKTRFNSLEED